MIGNIRQRMGPPEDVPETKPKTIRERGREAWSGLRGSAGRAVDGHEAFVPTELGCLDHLEQVHLRHEQNLGDLRGHRGVQELARRTGLISPDGFFRVEEVDEKGHGAEYKEEGDIEGLGSLAGLHFPLLYNRRAHGMQ